MITSVSTQQPDAEIVLFPCLNDNYGYLIHDKASGQTAVVDTPDADEIIRQLQARDWQLTHILTTHHHWDHIDGHLTLKEHYDCQVVGPQANQADIPELDQTVVDHDRLQLGSLRIEVIATPGHTLGHVAYWLPELNAVFVGDTLFSLGCGRLFEGTPQQMWQSILRLRDLPDETAIYCGHEYTESNARFALTLEPDNQALLQRSAEVTELRSVGHPTIPTTVQQERLTNPFMRADQPELQQQLQMTGQPAAEVFAEVRRRKDQA